MEAAFNTSTGLQIDGMVEHECGNLEELFINSPKSTSSHEALSRLDLGFSH
jgi:hypothetical protein